MSDSAFRPGSEEEWEALMRQLRLQSKAQPQPFFYARIQARLLAPPAGTTPGWRWLRRPAYAALLSAVLLATSGDGSVAAPAPATQGSRPAQQLPH